MQTGFDIMEYDSSLRRLWARRIVADLIDFVITLVLAFSITYIIPLNLLFIIFILQGIIWFLYSVIFDIISGKTPGKYVTKIKAVSFIGNLNTWQAVGRNLTKISWIIFAGDIIAGLSTEGDPRQRISERLLDSLVISDIVEERGIKTFKIEEKEELELP